MQDKMYKLTLDVEKQNMDSDRASIFSGKISFIVNQFGIINAWKINFDKVVINTLSQRTWFSDKPTFSWRFRDKLFDSLDLNLKQEIRIKNQPAKLFDLKGENLAIFNRMINDRSIYPSTFKTIIQIIKGNNAGGEVLKPTSGEFVIKGNSSYKNFVLLCQPLTVKNSALKWEDLDMALDEITLKEFSNLSKEIKYAFSEIQKPQTEQKYRAIKAGLVRYFKKYSSIKNDVDKQIIKSRRAYVNNIKKMISTKGTNYLPFEALSDTSYQKAHIYEVHTIRIKMIDAMLNGKTIDMYIKQIEDVDNFLPMRNDIHSMFDADSFTYKSDTGEIWAANEDTHNKIISGVIPEKYHRIPEYWLNPNRKRYLEMRNQSINW